VKILKTPGKFISSAFAEVDPRIFTRQHFFGVRGDWSYSSVDVKKNPTRGLNIEAGFNAGIILTRPPPT
jgi:hypothetical protein